MTRSSKKGRSAISTIVGGALVVGVILSVIAPLFAYYNDLDNFYDGVATEMRILDQQRSWEELDVSARNTEEGLHLTIINTSPAAIDIVRIWIVPNNWDHYKTDLNINLRSGDYMVISDDGINGYVAGLDEDEVFSVKIATDKGNYFDAYFPLPESIAPGYKLPLFVEGDLSWMTLSGGTYTFQLTVTNQYEEAVIVDYLVVTTVYEAESGGHKSEISTINVDPNAAFPYPDAGTYPGSEEWLWVSHVYSFAANRNAIVIKLELVDINNYVIGAYYFTKEDITEL